MPELSPAVAGLIFAAGTAFFVWVSRGPLRHPRSHGFTRFFAFEAILVLVLLNQRWWEHQMWSPRQLLSWTLLGLSLGLVWLALRQMRVHGQRDAQRNDPALYGFEKTARLVTSGVFARIRHPMYASLLALAWGVYLKHLSWASTAAVTVATLAILLTAWRDEAECLRYFGDDYAAYMKRTWRFIPGLY